MKNSIIGVIWIVAPESKIQVLRGSILGFFVIVKILLKIEFLPEFATEVDPTIDEELESRSSTSFSLVFNASISLFSADG